MYNMYAIYNYLIKLWSSNVNLFMEILNANLNKADQYNYQCSKVTPPLTLCVYTYYNYERLSFARKNKNY